MLWSIIPAAFIGPGTVTTCSKAGAGFGLQLLWALTFSAIATIVLQESAARITLASGKSLGEIIVLKYEGRKAVFIRWFLFGAVAFGCAAYQAGNILGAVSGLALLFNLPHTVLTLACGATAAFLLWKGSVRLIANALALIVFTMGMAFVALAILTPGDAGLFVKNALLPAFPEGSALLVIGLVGTTVVPYNLFLAGGLSKGQDVAEMRWGIGLAVLIGGVISMAILVAGTQIEGDFSFQAMAAVLQKMLGKQADVLFAFGLFAAGLSSAVTAPLAAAIAGQSLLGNNDERWQPKSQYFRAVWAIVLATGLLFGLLNVKPIPAIIAAQAVNGVLLPFVAVFLLLAVNDRRVLPEKYVNATAWNVVMGLVVAVVTGLGVYNFWKAIF